MDSEPEEEALTLCVIHYYSNLLFLGQSESFSVTGGMIARSMSSSGSFVLGRVEILHTVTSLSCFPVFKSIK